MPVFHIETMWKDFFKDYPLISYDVEEYTYRQSIELLNNKELDILIISDYTPGKEYYQYELKTQERVLPPRRNILRFRRNMPNCRT